jgi:3-oxoacyl-[acyl-carrier protein] reductase
MGELSGKVAIVTGGSRGIGAAAAAVLAEAGAAVTVLARNGAAAAQVADAIVARGGHAFGISCDISDYTAVEAMVAETNRRFGTIDILVNNAAVLEPIGFLTDSDPAAWRRNIDINLVGPYNTARAVLPAMLAAGGGMIINVSTGAAHRPMEGWSAYCAAKAALAMLTDVIELEIAQSGIRVFGLSPGAIDTDMQVKVRASGINWMSRKPRADLAPVEHPAAAIRYLCTGAAADLVGREVSLADPEFRRRVGLA